jgi:hypothetical protein
MIFFEILSIGAYLGFGAWYLVLIQRQLYHITPKVKTTSSLEFLSPSPSIPEEDKEGSLSMKGPMDFLD